MTIYFRYELARVERQRVAEMSKGAGRPKVGGEFQLVDHEGRPFGDGDMKGGLSLVSGICDPKHLDAINSRVCENPALLDFP